MRRIRFRIGQRPEENAVEDAEECDVGADSKRKRDTRGEGEPGILDKDPDRVANILEQRVHDDGRQYVQRL
jgi:hypothetical protein